MTEDDETQGGVQDKSREPKKNSTFQVTASVDIVQATGGERPRDEQGEHDDNKPWCRRPDVWTALGAIAAVGVALWSVSISQQTMQLDQRAWVLVAGLRFAAKNPPLGESPVEIFIGAKNTGAGPAIDLTTRQKVAFASTKPPFPSDFALPPNEETRSLGPLGSDEVNELPVVVPVLPANELEIFKSGGAKLYVFAKIEYRDQFGTTHITTYCAFHVPRKEGGGFQLCPYYNYAN